MTRVDWPTVLADIAYLLGEEDSMNPVLRVPIGERRLADYLGVHREALRRWKLGAKVEYHDGVRFLEIWSRLSGKAATFVPRERGSFSASKVSR